MILLLIQAQTDSCLRRFLRAFEDVDEAYVALIKYINWREEYGVNCLSQGDDDIDEQIAMDKAEVLDFPDHKGRSVCDPFLWLPYPEEAFPYINCMGMCCCEGYGFRQFSLG